MFNKTLSEALKGSNAIVWWFELRQSRQSTLYVCDSHRDLQDAIAYKASELGVKTEEFISNVTNVEILKGGVVDEGRLCKETPRYA